MTTGDVPRPATIFVKEMKKKNLVCAEIGVREGINARSIMDTLDIKKLYLIDPYSPYKSESKFYTKEEHDKLKEEAKERMKTFRKKVVFVEKPSVDAAKDFPDNFFDMVYIDSDHRFEYITEDIQSWLPKVKNGGVLSGHDYDGDHPGVVKAVNEFFKKDKKKIASDWMVKKNGFIVN